MSDATPQPRTLKIFAPAKINLFLHITGKRADGYHLLDSLAAFADIGDQITIEPSSEFTLHIDGPYAGAFSAKETESGTGSGNLVALAAWEMSRLARRAPEVRITLTKNLPLGAGIGGGSSDAAATMWGLMEYWNADIRPMELLKAGLRLGADVPVCLPCRTSRMQGTGEILTPLADFPEIPVVLVSPGKGCSTAQVFARFGGRFRGEIILPERFHHLDDVVAFLKDTANDLGRAACEIVPEIENAQTALRMQSGCALARMSGSGSACFGLFESAELAVRAEGEIAKTNPDWWVKAGTLGRPERY